MLRKSGHLFVVHADLTKLSCDGVLIPCDGDSAISRWWFDLFDVAPRGQWQWEPLPDGATLRSGAGPKVFELVDTVSVGEDLALLVDRVTSQLAHLAGSALVAHQGRDVPLVALPLPGTGNGNFAHRRGAVVQALVPALAETARTLEVDVALVVRDRRDYSAIQGRQAHDWDLTAEQAQEADRLGALAGAGQLSVFVGAGASVPLGLPSWLQLINCLRREAGLTEIPSNVSDDLEFKRAASEAAEKLGGRYPDRVEHAVRVEHHALSHGLLASLQTSQSATTNFDVALETAMATTHGPGLKVIRKDWATSDAPWLLKLHGTAGDPRGVVLTAEEYAQHADQRQPLYSMIQGLLMTSHLLFVGFSLTDSAYLELAKPVARIYAESDAQRGKVATAVGLRTLENPDNALNDAFYHVHFSREGAAAGEAARLLEVFLDRVAWTAARSRPDAFEYLLDHRYEDLVEQSGGMAIRNALETLQAAARVSGGPLAARVGQTLQEFGASDSGP